VLQKVLTSGQVFW